MRSVARASALFSLVSLCSGADPFTDDGIIPVTTALYVVIGFLGFHCLLISLCCFFTIVVCHINSKEEGGQRKRKNRTGDYLQRTESGGDLKKIDLSHGSNPPESQRSFRETSCTLLDPESPSLSSPTDTSDTDPLLDTLFEDKEPSKRERGHKHQRKPLASLKPTRDGGDSTSIETTFHPHNFPMMSYRIQTSEGRSIVNEGVLNPAYEENTMPTTLQLKSELIAISDKWFQIGLRLKVPSSTLNAIRRVNPHDNESCLMKMCQEWVVREEEPSWLDIVQALESRVVSEKRLADVIRMRYCDEPPLDSDSSMRQGRQRQTSDSNEQPSTDDFIKYVKTSNWFPLGLKLKISDSIMRNIKRDSKDSKDATERMCVAYLEGCSDPTWGEVVGALRDIGDERLARELERRFC